MKTETSGFVDELLFGSDPSPRITAVTVDRADSRPTATLYFRDANGNIRTEAHPHFPFFLLDKIDRLRGFDRKRFRFQELAGNNHYRNVVVFDNWTNYYDAVRTVERNADQPFPPLVQVSNPAQQYLMQSGKTLFKQMQLSDVRRMQLDIEVSSNGSFPVASRKSDEVIIVALSDNTGWEHLVHSHKTEADLLSEVITIIRDRDPDVIEGHNIFRFDLTYLRDRCRLNNIAFTIGRDGTEPRVFQSSMRFAERSFEFPAFEIAGRHVIDTFLLAMGYDVFKRNLPGYGLKAVARYFGFASAERTYIKGDEIADRWRSDPDSVLAYALDDVRETGRIAEHLCGSAFYLTQMLPMNYQDVARTGPGIKIESLLMREYLRERHSIPAAREIGAVSGAYTDVFVSGVVGPIVYADVESLYPSIMLQHAIRPSSDQLNAFTRLLRRLTDLRLVTKAAMNDATDERASQELDARQSSFKVLINAFYGYLGFGRALFNDSAEADRVTRTGQEILRTLISLIITAGGTVIEVDTDGVFFVPPSDVSGEDDEDKFVSELNQKMPAGIRLGIDGRFARMLSYKIKNYALLDYDDKLTFKGSSLVSRSSERFGGRFVRRCVRLILDNDIEGLHALYLSTRQAIIEHDWESVSSFSRTETLKMAVDQYESHVLRGTRSRSAAYEVAIARRQKSGEQMLVGDRISYYVTGQGANVLAFECAKDASEWSRTNPDENTEYYVRRLNEFASKFQPFFKESEFKLIFSPEDLFGFSSNDIRVQTISHPPVQ